MKIDVELPTIIEDVKDYHEFGHIEDMIRKIFNDKKFKFKEAGFYNGRYVGVAYYGKKTKKVKKLFDFVKKESAKELY